jgi:tricorn protease
MTRKPSHLLLSLIVIFTIAGTVKADPIKFARDPHICNGRIAFSYHGDIWVADEDGSNPYRLTAHVAMDQFPRFSPDGRWIAFTSSRMGNNDIYVVPTTGGVPRQVTFNTTSDMVLYWTPDGKRLLFSTSRGASGWGTPLYTVSAEGDLPVPMEMDMGAAGMIKQDGSMITFNRLGFRYWRKGYRGNRNTDIWVQNLSTKEIIQLTDRDIRQFREHTQDAYPMWGADGMIYFMSERDGVFNIWKIAPAGGDPVQVTSHRSDGVQYPSISPDGRTIVYENEFELWKLSIPDGRPQKIAIDLDFDPKGNLVEYLQTQNEADGFSPSPEGDYVAVDYHGEIFIVPTDPEVGEKKQVTSSGWRDRYQVYSPDGGYLAYISDESGDQEIWLYEVATGERRRISRHESEKSRPIWSGDSKQLAYTAANRLFLVDAAGDRTRELAHNSNRGFSLATFSPDGQWLVYTRSDEAQDSDVYLFNISEQKEYNVTQNPFTDRGGLLTPDGTTLIFTSSRDGGTTHLFKVSLQRLTEDPDDPLVRERRKNDRERRKEGREEEEKEEEEAAPAIRIDLDGIDMRAVQLTSGSDGVSGYYFLSSDGHTIYFLSRDERGSGLFSIGIDGKDRKKVTDGSFSGMVPTQDRKTIFYRQGRNVYRMPLSNKNKERVDFGFSVVVDRKAEWLQIFDEAWRVMKYRFYDENMHGFDWDAIKRRYEPLLQSVGLNQDLYDLANEMIGELNASHTGVSGPSGIDVPTTYRTRFLGFEMEPDGSAFKITHIYGDGPADKEWIDINVGDYVLAIDSHEIKPPDNYWEILNHTLNEYVTVRVASSPRGRDSRDIRISTVSSLRNIQYEEWVKRNREFVERESDGQIAYVHIRSMNQSSLRVFENEINQFWNAKGIIVDIRYNGGGNTDQQLLDILERRPYEYWNYRWSDRSAGRRPRQAIAGPKVMLINARSGSDSEVTPMGFRDLGLGRIVGTPTLGGVIATGSYSLINGGRIRTPGSLVVTYDPTKPNNYGVNLENYGVAPDVWAENTPEDELRGYDRELKEAVDEALRMLREGTWLVEGAG